jgi:outer membrane protein assembly factor BamB
MDYDGRQVRWYWLLLFVVYSGVVIYLLFNGNPYLYSHHELRAAMSRGESMSLLTIPAKSTLSDKVGASTFFQRFNFSRSSIDPIGTPRSKNYEEYQQFPVKIDIEGFEVQNIAQDDSGFYLTGKSPWVIALGLDGEVRWKFRFIDVKDDKSLPTILLDETTAYVVHPAGEALALNKTDGAIRWLIHLDNDVVSQPFLWQNQLVIPVKGTKASQWMMVKRGDGKLAENSPTFDFKPGFLVSQGPSGKSIIVTQENKLINVSADDWKVDWTQTLTDPIKGPAVVVDQFVYVTTLGSKLVKIDASKKGKVEWEVDLEKPPASAPTYLPVANRLSVMLDDGILIMVDAKAGKPLWSYNTLNKSPLVDSWSVRLSAKHIEEYKMDWLHKGWSVWSSCSSRHFCIYTPNKGQLVQTVPLSAQPVTLPLQMEKRWVFFGLGKDGKYLISHLLEASEIKKLKEAEKVPGS